MSAPGYLTRGHPLAIAHRGGSLEAEENTLAAFDRAVAMGFTHVETDVHLSVDGEVIIHHDPTLERMTGDPRAIATLTWRDLAQVRTRGGAGIPRLVDLIESHPHLAINIEAKSDAVVEPLARLIRRMGVLDRVGVGSFAPARTARLRALLGPGLCWSPAHRGVLGLWLRGWGLPLAGGHFPVVQVPAAFRGLAVVTPRFVRAAHAAGVRVQVWTVDDAAQMHRFLDMGVDGLMTDRPSLLKSVLMARGAWREDA